jgi:hypothetical protein
VQPPGSAAEVEALAWAIEDGGDDPGVGTALDEAAQILPARVSLANSGITARCNLDELCLSSGSRQAEKVPTPVLRQLTR